MPSVKQHVELIVLIVRKAQANSYLVVLQFARSSLREVVGMCTAQIQLTDYSSCLHQAATIIK